MWEKLYAEPGFGIWMGNFRDILVDEEANAKIGKFIANKIRQRVKNPAMAEKLIPQLPEGASDVFGTGQIRPARENYLKEYGLRIDKSPTGHGPGDLA